MSADLASVWEQEHEAFIASVIASEERWFAELARLGEVAPVEAPYPVEEAA